SDRIGTTSHGDSRSGGTESIAASLRPDCAAPGPTTPSSTATNSARENHISGESSIAERGAVWDYGPPTEPFGERGTTMKKTLAAALAAAACAFAAPAMAQSAGAAAGFSKGKTHLVATAGTGYAFDESYLVLGLGVSYYLFDGFNV